MPILVQNFKITFLQKDLFEQNTRLFACQCQDDKKRRILLLIIPEHNSMSRRLLPTSTQRMSYRLIPPPHLFVHLRGFRLHRLKTWLRNLPAGGEGMATNQKGGTKRHASVFFLKVQKNTFPWEADPHNTYKYRSIPEHIIYTAAVHVFLIRFSMVCLQ